MSRPETPRVVLVDGGGANFASVQAAFERLGAESCISSDRGRIAEATHLVLPGTVRRLRQSPGRRVPHMGWNRLRTRGADALGAGLDDEYAYFVHSYAAPAEVGAVVAECEHGEPFAALVARGRLCGAQFHPERSARAGALLLRNFLERRA